MAFNILGINHKTAPVALREKVAFSEERLLAALRTLRQEAGVAEAVILSTCNRTEVYWAGSASGAELSQWLERHHGNNLDLASSLYVHQEQRAVEHAFSVASGLDSMVLGEAQILGQLKDAYRVAQEAGSTGPSLNKLFQAAFSAAKRVRSRDPHRRERRVARLRHGESGAARVFGLERPHRPHGRRRRHECPDGAAFHERRGQAHGHRQPHPGQGAGARGRTQGPCRRPRRPGPGTGRGRHRHQLHRELRCRSSPRARPEAAIRARRRRPIFMVDLAVPRDIEPAVADLEDVYLFSIDDLQQLVDENRQQRELAAGGARLLIDEEVARFLAESRAQDAGPAIRALRQQADGIRPQTVEQARRMLAAGKSTDEVIEYLANTLTNRLLHAPTQALRQAAELADSALAEAVTRLLTEERDRQ